MAAEGPPPDRPRSSRPRFWKAALEARPSPSTTGRRGKTPQILTSSRMLRIGGRQPGQRRQDLPAPRRSASGIPDVSSCSRRRWRPSVWPAPGELRTGNTCSRTSDASPVSSPRANFRQIVRWQRVSGQFRARARRGCTAPGWLPSRRRFCAGIRTNATGALVAPLASTPSGRLPSLSGGNSVRYPRSEAFGANATLDRPVSSRSFRLCPR